MQQQKFTANCAAHQGIQHLRHTSSPRVGRPSASQPGAGAGPPSWAQRAANATNDVFDCTSAGAAEFLASAAEAALTAVS
jgi:hypothetical protein